MSRLTPAALSLALATFLPLHPAVAAEPPPSTPQVQPTTPEMAFWMQLMRERAQRFLTIGRDWPVGRHQVIVEITFDPDGILTDQRLRVSSGYPVIDDGAMLALQRMRRVPRPPSDTAASKGRLRLPLVFHVGSPAAIDGWSEPNARFNDLERGIAFHVPAPLNVLPPRARPGYAWIVGVAPRADEPPMVAGQSRLCDVGLQRQGTDWQGLDQAQFNDLAHQARLNAELHTGAGAGNVTAAPDAVTFGEHIWGREILVTPGDRPGERHYLAVADTPQYRMTLTCATDAAHVERALPLFRAIASNLRIAASER